MPRVRLDDIDRHILSELQARGRITNVDLAAKAGISAPPCLRRVRALEESGYALPVVEAHVQYRASATYDDVLDIYGWLGWLRAVRVSGPTSLVPASPGRRLPRRVASRAL